MKTKLVIRLHRYHRIRRALLAERELRVSMLESEDLAELQQLRGESQEGSIDESLLRFPTQCEVPGEAA